MFFTIFPPAHRSKKKGGTSIKHHGAGKCTLTHCENVFRFLAKKTLKKERSKWEMENFRKSDLCLLSFLARITLEKRCRHENWIYNSTHFLIAFRALKLNRIVFHSSRVFFVFRRIQIEIFPDFSRRGCLSGLVKSFVMRANDINRFYHIRELRQSFQISPRKAIFSPQIFAFDSKIVGKCDIWDGESIKVPINR